MECSKRALKIRHFFTNSTWKGVMSILARLRYDEKFWDLFVPIYNSQPVCGIFNDSKWRLYYIFCWRYFIPYYYKLYWIVQALSEDIIFAQTGKVHDCNYYAEVPPGTAKRIFFNEAFILANLSHQQSCIYCLFLVFIITRELGHILRRKIFKDPTIMTPEAGQMVESRLFGRSDRVQNAHLINQPSRKKNKKKKNKYVYKADRITFYSFNSWFFCGLTYLPELLIVEAFEKGLDKVNIFELAQSHKHYVFNDYATYYLFKQRGGTITPEYKVPSSLINA